MAQPDLPSSPPAATPVAAGRMLRPDDFRRALACRPRARSTHFAAHHVAACPSVPAKPHKNRSAQPAAPELSTARAPVCALSVDDSLPPAPAPVPAGRWLGLVVPKKHARRSVTRTLIKREMRAAMARLGLALPPGLWVLRLKAPFDRALFPSPASAALLHAARDELQRLLLRAAEPG